MGKLVKLENVGSIVPIENGLREDSIKEIVRIHFSEPKKIVVPIRVHPYNSNLLVLLGGHNTSCVADVLNREKSGAFELYGWVVDSKKDFIPLDFGEGFRESSSMDVSNIGLYDTIPSRLDVMRVDSVSQLRMQYVFLRSGDALRKFVGV
ncbi:hypothetical protein HNV12_02000 [Methanococcoides sp. SA1]|nr:hypothetical protein [Methanococcoides sp. SA1]